MFAGYARQLLGLLDKAKAATVGQVHPERGRMRLAAVTTAGEHVLPRLLASFRWRCPEAEVSLEEGALEEWRCSPPTGAGRADADGMVPRHRAWRLVAWAGDELPATARLFLAHLADRSTARSGDRFKLAETERALFRRTSPD